jgi:hypothetical protein
MMGHKFDTAQIVQAVNDFSAYIPTEKMPPIMAAILGYAVNKDFWRNRDIFRAPFTGPIEASQEFTPYTHPLAIKFGQETGLSPDRMQYAFNQFVAPSNLFAGLVGAGLRRIMDTLPEKDREKSMAELITGIPGINSIVRATDPMTPFKNSVNQFKEDVSTRSYKNRRDFDILLEDYYSKKSDAKYNKIANYVNSQPEDDDRSRLIKQYEEYGAYRNIPNSRWWREVRRAQPEARAESFWERYKSATPAERTQLWNQAGTLPGIATEKFSEHLTKIMQSKPAQ